MHRGTALLPVLLILTACGDGDDGVQLPEHADISGTWTYSAPALMASFGIVCSVTEVRATVTQAGTSFSGSTEGGQWSCQSPIGDLPPADLDVQTVGNGMVDGNSVSFEIDGVLLFEHMGTVTGNSMSGTLTASGEVDPVGPLSFTGEWSATR